MLKTKLRYILSGKLYENIKKTYYVIKYFFLSKITKISIVSYTRYFFNRNYFHDYSAFQCGVNEYLNSNINRSLLRRNLHRIEKGFCFRERKKSFAVSFILETVLLYQSLLDVECNTDPSEISWGYSVLKCYFDATECEKKDYQQAYTIFKRINHKISNEVPFVYQNTLNTKHYQALRDILIQRKSVRAFKKEAVPDEIIENALNCASFSPSSCNRQSYEYYIFNDPEKAQLLARISAGTVGWVDEIQCIAVLIGNNSNYINDVNRYSAYIDATLSVMPFILSLESQGYSTCLVNWADDKSRRDQMSSLLKLRKSQRVIVSIVIGKADIGATVAFSKRKSLNEFKK